MLLYRFSIFLAENASYRNPDMSVKGHMIEKAMRHVYAWSRKVPWQLLRREQLQACKKNKLHAERKTFDRARIIALNHSLGAALSCIQVT